MNRRLAALFCVSVVDILGFGILIPLVPYMGVRFNTPPQWITFVLGTYSLCQLIAAPIWGRLSDRYGRRPILMSSLAGACLSYLILGVATNIWWLLGSRAVAGFMAGNISAAFAYAADVSEPDRRAGALGLIGAAIGLGFTLGPAIGGLLAGNTLATADFTRPALVSAALSMSALLLVALVLPESNTPARRAQHDPAAQVSAFAVLRARPTLRLLASATLLVTIAQSMLDSILGLWALRRFGLGPRSFGLLMFCVALFAILAQGVLVRILVPRLGETKVALWGVTSFVSGLLLVGIAPGLPVAFLGLALCGLGAGAFAPSNSALASKQSAGHDRGLVMGTYQSSTSLARTLGPFLSGPVFSAIGVAAPFLIGAGIALPAAWLVWLAGRSSATASK